jgi:general secretion pathway protein J
LIALAMAAAFRTVGQVESRVDARLGRLDQIRTVTQFLRGLTAQVAAHPLQRSDAASDGKKMPGWAATPTTLEWLGIMPARHGAGGRNFFRLAVEDIESGGPALVLRYSPHQLGQKGFPDWSLAESRVLVPNVTRFVVAAQSDWVESTADIARVPEGWQPGWPVEDLLPSQLRLSLEDEQGAWPDLVVSLYRSVPTVRGGGGFVVGGSR